MPWAAWVIGVLLASFWAPVVGGSAARAFMTITLLPISLAQDLFASPQEPVEMTVAMNNVAAPGEAQANISAVPWERLGWPGLIWLAILVALGVWIAAGMRARSGIRVPLNAFILIAGWPLCYWTAMQAFVHSL